MYLSVGSFIINKVFLKKRFVHIIPINKLCMNTRFKIHCFVYEMWIYGHHIRSFLYCGETGTQRNSHFYTSTKQSFLQNAPM